MKILFAAPDRDLLECFGKLLNSDGFEVVTAFDGTQVLSLLSTESFDIVVLDLDIPRIAYKKLIARIKKKRIPVIVLTASAVSAHQLTEEPLPNAFLPYPFSSDRIRNVILDTLEKASSSAVLRIVGIDVDVSGFRVADGPMLTAEEISVLQSFSRGDSVTTENGACISALNLKFDRIGSKTRIKYGPGKGFVLVTENE